MYDLQANAKGTLATTFAAGATSATLNSGHTFQDATKIMLAVQPDVDANYEIIEGTISGDSITSITRAKDNTSDIEHPANSKVWGVFSSSNYAAIFETLYPVGSIYTNATVATNPGTLLGFGTWTAFGAGRVMVGLDSADADFDTAEETGGAKTSGHTHTGPSHTHSIGAHNHESSVGTYGGGNTAFNATGSGHNDTSLTSLTTNASGTGATGTTAPSVVQPYIVVYMWKRTA